MKCIYSLFTRFGIVGALSILLALATHQSPVYGSEKTHKFEQLKASTLAALQTYNNGQPQLAKNNLKKLVGTIKSSSDPSKYYMPLRALLDICIWTFDTKCVDEKFGDYTFIAQYFGRESELRKMEFDQRIGLLLGELLILIGSEEHYKKWIEHHYINIPPYDLDPALYISRELVASEIYSNLREFDSSRKSLEKALSMIASIKDFEKYNFSIANSLTKALEILVRSNDIRFAYELYEATGDYIAKRLAEKSFNFAVFRNIEANLLYLVDDFSGSNKAIEQATSNIENSDFSKEEKSYFFSIVNNDGAINCLMLGDLKCYRSFRSKLLAASEIDANAALDKLENTDQLLLLARDSVAAMLGAAKLSSKHRHLLENEIDFVNDTDELDLYNSYRIGALIADDRAHNRAIKPRLGEQLANLIIRMEQKKYKARLDAFPLPNTLDRFVSLLAIGALLDEKLEPQSIDLVLKLIEIYNRKIRQADAESVNFFSSTTKESDRRQIRNWVRIEAKQRKSLIQLLNKKTQFNIQELIENINSGFPEQRYVRNTGLDYDWQLRRYFGRFADYNKYYRSQFEVDQVIASAKRLPGFRDIKGALANDEAYVTAFSFGNFMTAVCVNNSNFHFNRTSFDLTSVQADIKLISAALTASHPPSQLLDSQYPVKSALRLYDLVLRPLEECLADVNHVIWAPPEELSSLPLSALLSAPPEKLKNGYSLADADWVVKKFAYSQVLSSRAFLGSRRLRSKSARPDRLLAIGNPSLGNESSQRHLLRSSGALTNGEKLSELNQLPQTAVEINSIGKLLPNTSFLLADKNASESKFRRTPIEEYKYIVFATHGLIREEITGLSEAALVLTPNRPEDPFDDGLLTASQIADFNMTADFVALSACNTANFDYRTFGSHVSGLTSAFSIAGVPASLVTLWSVDSETSRDIVTATFKNLLSEDNRSPAIALAEAQREFIGRFKFSPQAHPRFWSPFLIHGDGGKLPRSHKKMKSSLLTVNKIDLLSQNGGEIFDVKPGFKRGSYFVSGIGTPLNNRYQGIVGKYGKNNPWTLSLGKIAGTNHIATAKNTIYTLGYFDGGDPVARTVLLAIGKDGEEKWRKVIDKVDHDVLPHGIAITKNKELIIATRVSSRKSAKIVSSYGILKLDLYGNTLADKNIDAKVKSGSSSAQLKIVGNKIILVDGSPFVGTKNINHYYDEYGFRNVCTGSAKYYLHILEADSLNKIREVETTPYESRDIEVLNNGRIYSVGAMHSNCPKKSELTLLDLTRFFANDMQAEINVSIAADDVLFKDTSVTQSKASDLIVQGNSLWIIGDELRVNAVEPPTPIDTNKAYAVSTPGDLDEHSLQWHPEGFFDGLVLKLNYDGELEDKKWVSTGTDTIFTHGQIRKNKLLIGGISGNEAALFSFSIK